WEPDLLASITHAAGSHADFHLARADDACPYDAVRAGVAHPYLASGAATFQRFSWHANGNPAVGRGDHYPVTALDGLVLFQLIGADHAVRRDGSAHPHADGLFGFSQVAAAELADIALAQGKVAGPDDGVACQRPGADQQPPKHMQPCR